MAKVRTEKELLLKYAVEQATLAKVKAANEQIKQSMLDIGKAAAIGGSAGASEIRRITKQSNLLQKELLGIEDGFHDIGDDVPKELQDIIDKVDQLNKSIREGTNNLQDLDEEFNQTTKDVARLGDIESQALALGGAARTAGAGGAGELIGAGAELFAVAEALPKLKAAAAGLPALIKKAAVGVGPGLATVGISLVALGAASAKVAGDISKQTKLLKGLVESQSEFFDVVANGSVELARIRIEETRATNAAAQAELEFLKAQLAAAKQTVSSADLLSQAAVALADIAVETPINVLEGRINELSNTIRAGESTINTFTRGIENNAFATETAADTLVRLNQAEMERVQILLAGAEEVKQSTINQRDLMRQSTEQLDAALLAIDDKALGVSAALGALRAADPTPQILSQIEAEEQRFAALRNERAFILTFAREAAAARESEAASLDDQIRTSEEAEQAAQERLDADRKVFEIIRETMERRAELEKNHADQLIALSERAAAAEQKVLERFEQQLGKLNQGLGRGQAEATRKNQRKILEAQIDAQREQVSSFREHTRSLEDIRRKADEGEFKLRQSRDFKGVANARRTARIQIEDEQRAFARKQEDSAEQLSQEATDRNRDFAEERQDRIRKFQQDISDARVAFARQRNETILAGRQSIMDARAKHRQELLDLQQAGIQKLTVRKQISDNELLMLRQVAQTAQGFFQQLASFNPFAGGGNTTTTNTNSNVNNNNVNISGQNLDDAQQTSFTVIAALQGLVQ